MSPLRIAAVALAGLLCITSSPALAAKPYRAPHTPDGRPDLQGVWTNVTQTLLQRPEEMKDLIATEAEAAAWEADDPANPWFAKSRLMRIDGKARSSIIVDPADGQIPYNLIGRRALADLQRRDREVMDNPEDRHPDERCLMAVNGSTGPPMLPAVYNAQYRILQTPGLVVIATEMIHDVRMIPLRAKHEKGPPKWEGDSIGRWDGETLVVETVDQAAGAVDRFAHGGVLHLTPGAVVTERFTRTSPTQIRYAFEVQDPSVLTQPWRGELVFNASAEASYEYACHEGNYALANVLRGARKAEHDAAEAAKTAAAAKPAATAAMP